MAKVKVKYNIFLKILFRLGLIKYGYSVNQGYPLQIREGSNKSIWLLTSLF